MTKETAKQLISVLPVRYASYPIREQKQPEANSDVNPGSPEKDKEINQAAKQLIAMFFPVRYAPYLSTEKQRKSRKLMV
jgi:hypothetical protein